MARVFLTKASIHPTPRNNQGSRLRGQEAVARDQLKGQKLDIPPTRRAPRPGQDYHAYTYLYTRENIYVLIYLIFYFQTKREAAIQQPTPSFLPHKFLLAIRLPPSTTLQSLAPYGGQSPRTAAVSISPKSKSPVSSSSSFVTPPLPPLSRTSFATHQQKRRLLQLHRGSFPIFIMHLVPLTRLGSKTAMQ